MKISSITVVLFCMNIHAQKQNIKDSQKHLQELLHTMKRIAKESWTVLPEVSILIGL